MTTDRTIEVPDINDVELCLDAALQSLRMTSAFKVTSDLTVHKSIQQQQKMWQKTCDDLAAQLYGLEDLGYETTGLHQRLHPLLQHVDYLNQLLVTCQEFQRLEKYLLDEMAEVKEASIALAKQILPFHLPKFEAGLEQFMDRCDQVADQLDALENKGHPIAELVSLYEKWVAMVEQFGEILDERTDALVLKKGG